MFMRLNNRLGKEFWKSSALESLRLDSNTTEHIEGIDLQILRLLQKDRRLSFNKIAKKLGISVGTAFNHVKNLEKEGIINGYSVRLDSGKLGYNLTAIIMIQAEGNFLDHIKKKISKNPNTISVYDITGDYDAVAIAKFKDRSSLNVFIKNLLSLPHTKRTVTHIALNVIREDTGVEP